MNAFLLNPLPDRLTVQVIDTQQLAELQVGQATPTICLNNYHYVRDQDEFTRPDGRRYRRVLVVFSRPEPGRRYRKLDAETLWKLLQGEQASASQVTDVLMRVE